MKMHLFRSATVETEENTPADNISWVDLETTEEISRKWWVLEE